MTLRRRQILATSLVLPVLAAPRIVRAQDTITIRMGVMKLVHSMAPYFYERFLPAGYRLEIIPYASPTDGKDAVVTKSVDYGTFGIAAAILGASAHQPVVVYGAECNKGMAVIARKGEHIDRIQDLKGKKVGILPGTTQQVFFLERLHMVGMSEKDIRAVRVAFADMPAALARGDIDAYVGAEPGPSLSLVQGTGKLVEYPYSTPMGSLNMILATHRETISKNPAQVRMMLDLQRKASTYAMANPDALVAMTVAKLGLNPAAVKAAVPNVQLDWQMTPQMMAEVKSYADHMLALKQIRALPDFATLLDPSPSQALAAHA
ncbi:MAG: NrtA/SsuA/CpmA family ABC transporter substrate-binding protein [Rhodospirillales bacterium]|nr:NrtA/SsuA/CpmA family ABC transporter substrate-binding protein [Rhodospirillales bacterium]